MNLEIVGGTDEQQQSVRLMLASDPETSFSYLDASGEPYNHHRTDGLWVMGYGSWWPTWTVSFSPADTFSVDGWGPHAEGSVVVDGDGSAAIQLADDLEVPMLYDVLMHMVGHIIIGYITQFDGPKDELTTAVGGSSSYWDVSGDNVQEGICEAFKDLALMGRRARDTLSRYQVTRGTISSLARTMNSDGADASHQVSGWGWHDGFYNQVNVGLSLPMTIVARTSSGPFTQLPVRDPDNTWTDGMESTPFGQAGNALWSYGGHAWVSPSDMPINPVPIGTGGWIDEGALADWESFAWPGVTQDAITFSLVPIRYPQHDFIFGPGALPRTSIPQSIRPNIVGQNLLFLANSSTPDAMYFQASGSYFGTWGLPGSVTDPAEIGYSAPPKGVINTKQWAYGSVKVGISYVGGSDSTAYNDGGYVEPPTERTFGYSLVAAGGASVMLDQALDLSAPWPYGVVAGDFVTGVCYRRGR